MNTKALSIVLSAAVLLSAQSADARLFRRKAKAAPETTEKKAATPYEKFLKKKGLSTASGVFTLHTEGSNVWMEFPDSLLGRKFLLSNIVYESSSSFLPIGCRASSGRVYQVSRTDSLLIISNPSPVVEVGEESIARALGHSAAPEIMYAFPIKYRNTDSTAVVVNASKLFGGSNKDAFNMTWLQLTERTKIYKLKHKSAFDHMSGPVSYGNTVGVRQNMTFGAQYMLPSGPGTYSVYNDELPLTADFETSLILLPERPIQRIKPDYRVGMRTEKYRSYSPDKGIEVKETVPMWDLSEGLTVYVDTLFSKACFDAISDAFTAWNPAFEKIGLGSPVKVERYPDSEDFRAADPFVNRVIADNGNDNENISTSILGSAAFGGNIGFTISVPGGYLDRVRRESVYTITDVDARYRDYYLPEDAVCDFLRSELITRFGIIFGLDYNRAGSWAYSPEQLRDPEFTREHGITASAMDGIVFNLLARPGDRERGVVTMLDRIGPYDYLAIDWLYGGHTEQERSGLLDAKEGMPEYLYLKAVTGNPDPRALAGDLGNDPVELYRATLSHLKFAAENAYDWISSVDLENESYRELFVDWLWLKYQSAAPLLAANVGGLYYNETSSGAVKFTPVPKALQKQCVEIIFDSFRDIGWLDADRRLLHHSGAYWNLQDFNTANMYGKSGLLSRLLRVLFSEKAGESDYGIEEFLGDIEKHLLENISKGRLVSGEDLVVTLFVNNLLKNSDVLKGNWNYAFYKKTGLISDDSFRIEPENGIPVAYIEDLEVISAKHLRSFREQLAKGRSRAADPIVKDRIGFIIKNIDAAFE